MILEPLTRDHFRFDGKPQLDSENKGFTQEELAALAGPPPLEEGAMGPLDWLKQIWPRNREAPPEIQNLRSEFGYQSMPLATDLLAVAKAQKTPLEGVIRASSENYNFYLMQCGVYIAPAEGERFEALKFEVYYRGANVATHSMLPGPETKSILKAGGKAEVGIDGKASFGIPEIPLDQAKVDASAKAQLEGRFIVSFDYELKTLVVDSFGSGTPFCKWFMHKGDKLRNDVLFYPILRTPKNVTGFDCEFKAYFKINHPDWKKPELFLKPPITVPVSLAGA